MIYGVIPRPSLWGGGRSEGEPIYILSDDDFTAENGVVGGSGTPDDPYVIAGWTIEVSEEDVESGVRINVPLQDSNTTYTFSLKCSGIVICNTTKHFVIRDCYINASINWGELEGRALSRGWVLGIVLSNVVHGRVENVQIEAAEVVVSGCQDVHVGGLVCQTVLMVDIWTSSEVEVSNCTGMFCSFDILSCSDVEVSDCTTHYLEVSRSRNITLANLGRDGFSEFLWIGIGESSQVVVRGLNASCSNCVAPIGTVAVLSSEEVLIERSIFKDLSEICLYNSSIEFRNCLFQNVGRVSEFSKALMIYGDGSVFFDKVLLQNTSIDIYGRSEKVRFSNSVFEQIDIAVEHESPSGIETRLELKSVFRCPLEIQSSYVNTLQVEGVLEMARWSWEEGYFTEEIEGYLDVVCSGCSFVGEVFVHAASVQFYDNIFYCTPQINASEVSLNVSRQEGPNVVGGPYVGGNWWVNYTGVDEDGDGFGDTPFELGPGLVDYLPLIARQVGLEIVEPQNGTTVFDEVLLCWRGEGGVLRYWVRVDGGEWRCVGLWNSTEGWEWWLFEGLEEGWHVFEVKAEGVLGEEVVAAVQVFVTEGVTA